MFQATYSQRFARLLFAIVAGVGLFAQAGTTLAQKRPTTTKKPAAKPKTPAAPKAETPEFTPLPPFRVDARIYQARPANTDAAPLSEQVFRLTTANLVDEERWVNGFAKVYPGYDLALVQSAQLRVYRSAKPARMVLGQAMNRTIELMLYGAYGDHDGPSPGTTIVSEVNLNFGKPEAVAVSIQTMEVEEGKTYFFAVPRLRFNPEEYVKFLRPGQPVSAFAGKDTFLIFSISVHLNPTVSPNRNLDEDKAAALQTNATKKVAPEVPPGLQSAGLSGMVRVIVEVAPSGKVTHAYILNSSFPEMNEAALKAARQWEFPISEFAQDPRPIATVLAFSIPGPTAK